MLRIFLTCQSCIPYIHVISLLFLPCGTLFRVLNVQVMWRYSERSIRAINKDRRSSLKSGGGGGGGGGGYTKRSYSSVNRF